MSGSDDDFQTMPEKKGSGGGGAAGGRGHANMKPEEREAMIEWLGLDREGQKDGQPMQNWRSIYGGAAKGRNMNEDAGEVHASGGYSRLAAFVNSKCRIKSDPKRAWNEEIAEKRFADLKKKYKMATRLEEPLNTNFDDETAYEKAKEKFEEDREKVCRNYKKIHELLKEHPAIHPYQPTDSMNANGDSGEPEMRGKEDTLGVKRTKKPEQGVRKEKKEKNKKAEFHLRKPDAPVSTGKQRMNIHQMFIETQQKQVELDKQKLLVDAIGKLAASGIAPENMGPYLLMMGLGSPAPVVAPSRPRVKASPPKATLTTISSDSSESSSGSSDTSGSGSEEGGSDENSS
jgi:hypothetical protein